MGSGPGEEISGFPRNFGLGSLNPVAGRAFLFYPYGQETLHDLNGSDQNLFKNLCFPYSWAILRDLSGRFRRSDSASQKFRRDTVSLPSAPCRHTNRSLKIALVKALSRPIPDQQQGEVGEKGSFFSQGLYLRCHWAIF